MLKPSNNSKFLVYSHLKRFFYTNALVWMMSVVSIKKKSN